MNPWPLWTEKAANPTPFVNEKKNGLAILDWIGKQSWCSGNVGMFGYAIDRDRQKPP